MIEKVINLLLEPNIEHTAPHVVGLHGGLGMGKSVLAKLIMNELANCLEEKGVRPGGAIVSVTDLKTDLENDFSSRKLQLLKFGARIGVALDKQVSADVLHLHLSSALATGYFILTLDDIRTTQDWCDLIVGNQYTFIIAISHRLDALSELIPITHIVSVDSLNVEEWTEGLAKRNPAWTGLELETHEALGKLLEYYPMALGPLATTASLVGLAEIEARLRRAGPADFGVTLSPEIPDHLRPLLTIVYEGLSKEGQFCYRVLGIWGTGWQELPEIYDLTFSQQATHALWRTTQGPGWTVQRSQARLLELLKVGLIQSKYQDSYCLHRLFLTDALERLQMATDEQTRQRLEKWYLKFPWKSEIKSWFSTSSILLIFMSWFLLTVIYISIANGFFEYVILILWSGFMIYISRKSHWDLLKIAQARGWRYFLRRPNSVTLMLLEVEKAKKDLNVDMYGMMKKIEWREKIADQLILTGQEMLAGVIVIGSLLIFILRFTLQNMDWQKWQSWQNVALVSVYLVHLLGTGLIVAGLSLKNRAIGMPAKLVV